ncbi:PaaI family thioesterase [Amycolatopsis speibonae]|uniref:Medium/long-chain acyl-CoA thioesterase YigI n=1 Tax=Amycolatopsis speibonae TaxID=1450224 RepID=A0ABV7P4F8_9PSEU
MVDELDPKVAEKATTVFTGMTFLHTVGARLAALAPGKANLEIEYRSDLCQHHGLTHPGILSGLADAACGLASITTLTPDRDLVAVEMKINFMSGVGPGQLLRATGTVPRPGRTLTVCTAHLHAVTADQEPTLVALAMATMMSRPARQEPGHG